MAGKQNPYMKIDTFYISVKDLRKMEKYLHLKGEKKMEKNVIYLSRSDLLRLALLDFIEELLLNDVELF